MPNTVQRDRDYLGEVLAEWRLGFARAEGENIPELYSAAARLVRAGDWEHVRPLLRVLRTILLINSNLLLNLSGAQLESRDPDANPDVAAGLQEARDGLVAARVGLDRALRGTAEAGVPRTPGAGRPAVERRIYEPDLRSLRGIVDTAAVVAAVGAGSIASVLRAAVASKNAPRPPPADSDGPRDR